MSELQRIADLQRQKDELAALISDAGTDGDVVAELNFASRLDQVASEIEELTSEDTQVGEVAVLFEGVPVTGTNAINASFAAKALGNFQNIVTRLFAVSLKGQLSSRGKIKGSELAELNITGLATGSFGFVLEESGAAQSSLVKTPIREAMEEAADLFVEFTSEADDDFLIEVDDINPRVFKALAEFFSHLEKNGASLKTNFPDRMLTFDRAGIERAYKRIADTHVKIVEERWVGKLVGLSPIKRTFDFKQDGNNEIFSGKFSQQISQDYLERIESEDGITLGDRFQVDIEIGTIRKPDGTISISYTMTDLSEV